MGSTTGVLRAGRCLASAGLACWVKGQASATGEPRDKYRAVPETKAFARTILRAGDRPTARPSEQPQHRTTSLPRARRRRRLRATGEPRDKYRAAPETKAFARTILRAGDRNRPTARPRCSMLSEQPQHRTTAGAGFVASVNQQRKCRSAATDAMAIEVKAFIRLSLSDQPFNGGGPNNLDQWEPVIRRSALIGQATEAKTYGSKAGPRICEVTRDLKETSLCLPPCSLRANLFKTCSLPLDHWIIEVRSLF